jgi:DNA (cytosine-5)-methyltransferase 1
MTQPDTDRPLLSRPRLLDLFCGAGGAARGYQLAGFHVTGVDNKPQPHYVGDKFVQADALEFCREHAGEFDAIHASPPCQGYSMAKNNGSGRTHAKLIEPTRDLLIECGKPYVIENVELSPLRSTAVRLCGATFGLGYDGWDLPRHRLFECSFGVLTPPCQHKRGRTIGIYGGGTNGWHMKNWGRCFKIDELRTAIGIDWMTRKELNEAIPPAYTQFIGAQLMRVVHP